MEAYDKYRDTYEAGCGWGLEKGEGIGIKKG